MSEQSKIVFITGASRGIGRAVANEFARAGCRLILTYHNNRDLGEQAAAEGKALGAPEVLLLQLDISDEASIKKAVAEIFRFYHHIDVLVNNPAIMIRRPLLEESFEEISIQVKTNLEGPIKLSKICLPLVTKSIINIGSNLAFQGKPNLAVYSATKFALRGFTQALAKERPDLRIYTVHPGLTATKMGANKGMAPAKVAEIIWKAAEGRYRAESGSDIKVKEYIYGEFLRPFLKLARALKSLFS